MTLYNQNNFKKEMIIFAFLCLLLEATLIVSDVLTFKITSFLFIIFSLPALLYPLSYAIGDSLTEAYGRKTTLVILALAISIEVVFDLIISYAATVHNIDDQHYYEAFKYSLGKTYIAAFGVMIASILGFATNTTIMYFLKSKFSYRSFPARSICSSLSGEIVFTIVASAILFHAAPNIDRMEILRLIIASSILKLFFSISYAFPAFWVAKQLLRKNDGGLETLRITDIKKLNDKAGESIFNFQILGKRVGFSACSKEVSLNMYCALNKADQNLIESDLKGKIHSELEQWTEAKNDPQKRIVDRWNERDWSRDNTSTFA